MRQIKNIIATLLAFSLAFFMLGTPVAFGAEQPSEAPGSATVDALATDQLVANSAYDPENPSATTLASTVSARSAVATAASAEDIEGFRDTLTNAWYDMTEGNIDPSAYGLTLDQANEVWLEIQYDNPLIFWGGDGYWHMCDGVVTGYQNDWSYSKSEVEAMMAEYDAKAAEAISWTSDDMTDFEKATVSNTRVLTTYSDTSSCGSWAIESMSIAVEQGIMKGAGGKLRPNDQITRCEAAALIKRTAQAIEG